MRLAELSEASGVSIPMIKYYVREGVLPPGDLETANRAVYGARHLDRLRLVRALIDVGGLTMAQVHGVLDLVTTSTSPLDMLAAAQDAFVRPPDLTDEARAWAEERLGEVLEGAGLQLEEDTPARTLALAAVIAIRDAGQESLLDGLLADYVDLAGQLAGREVAAVRGLPDDQAVVASAVVGSVLGGPLFNALRLLAHQSHSTTAWPPDAGAEAT